MHSEITKSNQFLYAIRKISAIQHPVRKHVCLVPTVDKQQRPINNDNNSALHSQRRAPVSCLISGRPPSVAGHDNGVLQHASALTVETVGVTTSVGGRILPCDVDSMKETWISIGAPRFPDSARARLDLGGG